MRGPIDKRSVHLESKFDRENGKLSYVGQEEQNLPGIIREITSKELLKELEDHIKEENQDIWNNDESSQLGDISHEDDAKLNYSELGTESTAFTSTRVLTQFINLKLDLDSRPDQQIGKARSLIGARNRISILDDELPDIDHQKQTEMEKKNSSVQLFDDSEIVNEKMSRDQWDNFMGNHDAPESQRGGQIIKRINKGDQHIAQKAHNNITIHEDDRVSGKKSPSTTEDYESNNSKMIVIVTYFIR